MSSLYLGGSLLVPYQFLPDVNQPTGNEKEKPGLSKTLAKRSTIIILED